MLDVTDPAGDDNGPGTYQYPTPPTSPPASFDITRFQVLTKDGIVYLRTTLRNLTPTFGNTLGAQLLDVYVAQAGATTTSTAAAVPDPQLLDRAGRRRGAQRLEVQGFAAPVWVDAAGNQVGTVTAVVASTVANTITIAAARVANSARRPRAGRSRRR